MTSNERKEKRFQRRKEKRLSKRKNDYDQLNLQDKIKDFALMFYYGLKCISGVSWKRSVQLFKNSLFSSTAKNIKKFEENIHFRLPYDKFYLMERGKKRYISAPRVQDRQSDKFITKEILLPIYTKHMVYDNGASLDGKGFHFSLNNLKKDLVEHYKKYGRERRIILIDFSQYFPSADKSVIEKHHEKYFFEENIKNALSAYVYPHFEEKMFLKNKNGNFVYRRGERVLDESDLDDKGMPLGLEPSQAEMIHFPSLLDTWLLCQKQLRMSAHYMDDYRIIVPPNTDYKKLISEIREKASEYGMTLNLKKTVYIPFTKSFRYCKIKFKMLEDGKILTKGSKKSYPSAVRRLKMFKREIEAGNRTYENLRGFVQSSFSYYDNWNDSYRKGKLMKMFKQFFGFNYDDVFMYNYNDAKKKNPELFEKIDKIIEDNKYDIGSDYICYRPFSGKDLFGNSIIINKNSHLRSRNGLLIRKNKAICVIGSETFYNHYCTNEDGHGIRRGNLICKILEQTKYTVEQQLTSRAKQWKNLNNCKEAIFYRENTKNEKEWIWKRSLWFASEKELSKILKRVNKKYG